MGCGETRSPAWWRPGKRRGRGVDPHLSNTGAGTGSHKHATSPCRHTSCEHCSRFPGGTEHVSLTLGVWLRKPPPTPSHRPVPCAQQKSESKAGRAFPGQLPGVADRLGPPCRAREPRPAPALDTRPPSLVEMKLTDRAASGPLSGATSPLGKQLRQNQLCTPPSQSRPGPLSPPRGAEPTAFTGLLRRSFL